MSKLLSLADLGEVKQGQRERETEKESERARERENDRLRNRWQDDSERITVL